MWLSKKAITQTFFYRLRNILFRDVKLLSIPTAIKVFILGFNKPFYTVAIIFIPNLIVGSFWDFENTDTLLDLLLLIGTGLFFLVILMPTLLFVNNYFQSKIDTTDFSYNVAYLYLGEVMGYITVILIYFRLLFWVVQE